MLPLKPFYIIRHGETEHNLAGLVAGGETDSALTSKGREQPQRLAPYLPDLPVKPVRIFHSSMSRARDTATYLNAKLDIDMEEVHDLREHELGDWGGLSWKDPQVCFSKDMDAPPNGESSAQFAARVQRALTYCLDKSQWGEPPLIVCHGGLFFGIGIMYNVYEAIHVVENCQLYYFEPHDTHPYFPWKIMQYEINGNELITSPPPFCATRIAI